MNHFECNCGYTSTHGLRWHCAGCGNHSRLDAVRCQHCGQKSRPEVKDA